MVCGNKAWLYFGTATGIDLDTRSGTRSISYNDVIRHMGWHALQNAQGFRDCFTGLEHVAQDCGDAKATTGFLPPAIGKRYAETSVVDAVGQAPDEFNHAHDPAAGPGTMQQQAFVQVGRQIVVAHKADVIARCRHSKRAPTQIAWRAPSRQETRGAIRSASQSSKLGVNRH